MSVDDIIPLADGRIHKARASRELKLVDAVEDHETALAELRGRIDSSTLSKAGARASATGTLVESVMANETTDVKPVADTKPMAATLQEIKAAIPDAGSDALVSWLEKGMTLAQCKDAHMDVLRARATAAQTEAEKARAARTRPGVDPIRDGGHSGSAGGATGDPIGDWNQLVNEKAEQFKGDQLKAVKAAKAEQPDLHKAYLAAYNEKNADKFESQRRSIVAAA